MSTVIYNKVDLRGHVIDLAPLLRVECTPIMGGIVGDGWGVSVKGAPIWQTLEFFPLCMTDNLRDVLCEILNSCTPVILDALIDGVIEAEGSKLKAMSGQHDRNSVNPLDKKAV
jgi:hypothetical protein